jgi:hypothetical protein
VREALALQTEGEKDVLHLLQTHLIEKVRREVDGEAGGKVGELPHQGGAIQGRHQTNQFFNLLGSQHNHSSFLMNMRDYTHILETSLPTGSR